MSLRSKFIRLNNDAMSLEKRINKLQLAYLKDTDISFEEDVEAMLDVYMYNFEKAYKEKFSFLNELKCKFSKRYFYMLYCLDAPHGREILASASEKTMFHIINNCCADYIPYDRKSENEISDKLYPIVQGINLSGMKWFYQMMKDYAWKNCVDNIEDVLMYLQEMFSDFILLYLMDNSDKHKVWTTEEVCKTFLEEEVIINSKKILKKEN